MDILPQYIHIVNTRLKHTYLTFDDEANLIIKSPKVSLDYIEKLLLKKSAWINTSKEKILQKKGKRLDFNRPETLYFLGETYTLTLVEHTKKRTKLTFWVDEFMLYYHHYNEEVFQKCVNNFYKEEAKQVIPSMVERWSKKMGLNPNKISFRKTKRQWGSCSGKNDLSFNTMMMRLPLDVIEYIIVHELAHIKHKHHQKSFWKLVEEHLPDYKTQIATLKEYTT